MVRTERGAKQTVLHGIVSQSTSCTQYYEMRRGFEIRIKHRLIRRQTSTKRGCREHGIHILREESQVPSVKADVFLERAVLVMEVVRGLERSDSFAVLFRSCQAGVATSADSRAESDSD